MTPPSTRSTPSTPSTTADEALRDAQARYLDRVAPGHKIVPVRWSGGATQAIELGAGPPLLLIHGGLGEAFQWGPLLPPLAARRRVIAVDRPGHGLADAFDYRGVDFRAHAVRFVGDVLDALGVSSAPIIGSSMGGFFALAFALAHPDRVPALVLQSPAGATRRLPTMLTVGSLPGLKGLVRGMMRRPTRESVRGFWKQLLVARPERLTDDFLDLSAASQARNAESWFSLLDRVLDIRGLKSDVLAAARFEDVTAPLTLLWGEKDAFAGPEHGRRIAARAPRARLVIVPGAGHVPWLDQPEATLAAIEAALPPP